MNEVLLSICIPTFNRSIVLKKTIESIVCQKEFIDYAELVISDNCSTDDTFQVVKSFQEKHPNIKYIRNDVNIGAEKNVFKVLSYGEGKFLKLINDYSAFNVGSLKQIIDIISKYEKEHSIIFFSNKRLKLDESITECKSFDDFFTKASYSITWMLYFGIWKTEFDKLIKGSFNEYNFPHVDLLLRNLKLGYRPVILNNLIVTNQTLSSQGGYDLFEVFIQNYLTLISQYVGENQISIRTFNNEKKKLLHGFIYPWYCIIAIEKSRDYSFSIKNGAGYLTKYFSLWDILKFTFNTIIYRIKRITIILLKKSFLKGFLTHYKDYSLPLFSKSKSLTKYQ